MVYRAHTLSGRAASIARDLIPQEAKFAAFTEWRGGANVLYASSISASVSPVICPSGRAFGGGVYDSELQCQPVVETL